MKVLRIALALACLAVLAVVFATSVPVDSQHAPQQPRKTWFGARKKADLENPFASMNGQELATIFKADVERGPSGNWIVTAIPNRTRYSPVTVVDTVSFMASGKFTNLIVGGVTLLNAAYQPVESVALRWSVVNVDKAMTLAEGETVNFEVNIDSRLARKVKCPHINFAKVVRPLVRSGQLAGRFQLQIGVSSVRFADGTLWRDLAPAEFSHSVLSGHSTSWITVFERDVQSGPSTAKPNVGSKQMWDFNVG